MAHSTCFDTDLHGEPTLDELFADPIMRLIMTRDGVEESTMRTQIDRMQRAYATLTQVQ